MEKNEEFFREFDGDSYYRITQVPSAYVTITEAGDNFIIIYDSRISKKVIDDKFTSLELLKIDREKFDNRMIEKFNKKEEK